MKDKKVHQNADINFDKRSVPGIIVFVLLLFIGVFLFFYWRLTRGIGETEEKITVTTTIFPILGFTYLGINYPTLILIRYPRIIL